MRTTVKLVTLAALLALGSRVAAAQDSLFEPRLDEVLLGPFPVNQTVQGVPLSGSVSAFLSLQIEAELLRINARLVADLSDLQRKAGALVDTIPLPTDNCAHFSFDNVVAKISGKEITISGNVAALQLKGNVEIWTCLENPVLCTKIEFDEKDVFGAKIRIPRVVTFKCNPPIKTSISQPFEATLPFQLVVENPQTIKVTLGNPDVDLQGPLGDVTSEILKIAGVQLGGWVREALNRAASPDLLKVSVPEDLLRLNPAITRAELLSNSGALAATVEINATVDADILAELIGVLEKNQAGE